jgi:cell cycle arrest protein BUB3
VLAACFSDDSHGYSGCLDASVRQYVHIWFRSIRSPSCLLRLNFETEKIQYVGQHNDSISSMNYSSELSVFQWLFSTHYVADPPTDVLITGSWDQTVRFWDPRSVSPQQHSHELPERVYHMDLTKNTLVVAMASRLFHIYDIRKMDAPAQQRESSLKFMTRSLACMVDGQGGRWGLPSIMDVLIGSR